MTTNSSFDGPGDAARGNSYYDYRAIFEALGQRPDGAERGAALLRSLFRSDRGRAKDRSELCSSLKSAQEELADLGREIPKMDAALAGGPAYLPADHVSVWPRTWPGRIGLFVFGGGLVLFEFSTALNVSTLSLPIVQSKLTAWAMAAPIAMVPAATKLLFPPYNHTRIWLGASSLVSSLVYAFVLSCVLNTPGDGLNLGTLFQSQLVAEMLGLCAITAVIAKLITPPPSEAVKRLLDAANERRRALAGEVERLTTLLDQLQSAEEAFVAQGVVLIQLASATREATEEHIRNLRSTSEATFKSFFAPGRTNQHT